MKYTSIEKTSRAFGVFAEKGLNVLATSRQCIERRKVAEVIRTETLREGSPVKASQIAHPRLHQALESCSL